MFILASGVFSLHYVVGPLLFPCIATSEKQCGGVEGILGKATRDREANSTIRLRCTWLSHGYYWLYIILLLKLYMKMKYKCIHGFPHLSFSFNFFLFLFRIFQKLFRPQLVYTPAIVIIEFLQWLKKMRVVHLTESYLCNSYIITPSVPKCRSFWHL